MGKKTSQNGLPQSREGFELALGETIECHRKIILAQMRRSRNDTRKTPLFVVFMV